MGGQFDLVSNSTASSRHLAKDHQKMAQLLKFFTQTLLCVVLMCGSLVYGASLEVGVGEIRLGGELRYIEDPRSSLSLDEAIDAIYGEGVLWNAPGFPVFGYTDSTYWAAVSIDNRLEHDEEWLMKMAFAPIDVIEFYYQDRSGDWVVKKAGDTQPIATRDVVHHSILFQFPVYAQQMQTFYFRVHSTGSVQLPISILSSEEFQKQSSDEYLWIGLFFGALAILCLYSFAIWCVTLDKSYLYFSLFLLSDAFYILSFQGLAYQFLWPDNIYWANRSLPTFTMLACATGSLFILQFFNLRKSSPKLDRVLFSLAIFALVYAVIGLVLPLRWTIMAGVFIVVCILIAITVAVFDAIGKRKRQAMFVACAWGIMMMSVLIEVIQRMGVNFPQLLSFHGIQFGSVFGAFAVALGLGDRIRMLLKSYGSVQSDMLKANQQKIEALQQADDVKEEFIANVSHELKTPLTGIIGLSEIILDSKRDVLDESTIDSLNMIKISGQRLSNLVNDVIDFSSIKHGDLVLNRRAIDLKHVCTLVNKMCRPMIGDKPIQLAEQFPDEPIIVLGDEDRLQQILFNLVSNAIKFTPKGWIAISIEKIDIDVRVSVKDTGVGISREQQARIFNRFYQVDSAATREKGGTGLGLAISQKLVELHGTEIVLRSSLGEGSTFYFDLPLYGGQLISNEISPGPEPSPRKHAEDTIPKLIVVPMQSKPNEERRTKVSEGVSTSLVAATNLQRRRKVLVVDDEYLNVRIVKEHLSSSYDVVTALGGLEALEIIEKDKPDLIILDLMMPIMTGFELCERVRLQYSLDELPIVILTAKNRVEDLVKGLSIGANDYISKPFSKEVLRVRVGKQIELLDLVEVRKENQLLTWQLHKYQENEKRLRERETRLASMLDVTGDALISINGEGNIVYVNQSAEKMLSVSGEDFGNEPLLKLVERLESVCPGVEEVLKFPFDESAFSTEEAPVYFEFSLLRDQESNSLQVDAVPIRLSILMLSLDQDFYLVMVEEVSVDKSDDGMEMESASLPQLINQINKNVERTQILTEYLAKITPEDLQNHKHLFSDLESVDKIIHSLTDSLPKEEGSEQDYREALVKLMQDCHYYWQKVTGESIIDLAEKSRIWSVSIDNGRLRTRSMNRYLSVDKLPKNPRWRQVARTAYFVLSKVSNDPEAKAALEKSVAALQEIVEIRALN